MLNRVEKRPTASRCGARPNDDWAATRASLRSLNPRRVSTRSDTILRDSAKPRSRFGLNEFFDAIPIPEKNPELLPNPKLTGAGQHENPQRIRRERSQLGRPTLNPLVTQYDDPIVSGGHRDPVCVLITWHDRTPRVARVDGIGPCPSHDLSDSEATLIEEESDQVICAAYSMRKLVRGHAAIRMYSRSKRTAVRTSDSLNP